MAFDIPTLPPDGYTPEQFQIWWQGMVSALQSQFAEIEAAVAAAQAAADDALAALNAANVVARNDKITSSWTVPDTVLSAADVGTDVTVTVLSHTRMYGDGTQLAVGGHAFTGRAYSTAYAVYYDDTTTSDTTPTYHITTTLSNAQNNFVAGRHFVGEVMTPASGGATTSGGTSPPGSGSGGGSGKYPSY